MANGKSRFSKKALLEVMQRLHDNIQRDHAFDPMDGTAQLSVQGECMDEAVAYGRREMLIALADYFNLELSESIPDDPEADDDECECCDHGCDCDHEEEDYEADEEEADAEAEAEENEPDALAKIAEEFGHDTLPDNRTHINRMEIRSESSNRIYIVAQRATNGSTHGQWECSCMGWIRHRRCKHLTAMMPALRQLGSPGEQALKRNGR